MSNRMHHEPPLTTSSLIVPAALAAGDRSFVDRLAGLSRVSWADDQVYLGWQIPLPVWAWVLIALAALAFGCWTYRHLLGPAWARMGLGVVRSLVILLIVALLLGPMLVRPDERVEPDTLLLLVDRSASMQVQDMTADGSPDAWISRDDALRRALHEQARVFGDEGVGRGRTVTWRGFGGETFAFNPPLNPSDAWQPAARAPTNLRTAIEQALAHADGQPISGIVLFTDGRSRQATGSELIYRLQEQAVSLFTVPLGRDPMPADVRLGRIDYPEQAFVDDTVPVTARVQRFGGQGDIDPAAIRLRLIDTATNTVLDETTLEGASLGEPIRLQGQSDTPGPVRWRVELEHDASDSPPLLEGRHRRALLNIEMIDRPLRVLYVEGYPRWTYRYLTAMLVREESIASSILLLSADRAFAQEGDRPITRFPRDREELSEFDVIILGDVPADDFSSDQLTLIREHVADDGAGLLWLAGERHTPQAYERTPLADLLPMPQPDDVTPLPHSDRGLVVLPTAHARALNILELVGPDNPDNETAPRLEPADDLPDPLAQRLAAFPDWPASLPALHWAQQITRLKPTAEVLATGIDPAGEGPSQASGDQRGADAQAGWPLIARLRYGAGQSLYIATDEMWRWRYGRGELYFEQFWIQLVRMLGRQRVQQNDDRASLTTSSRRVQLDQSMVVNLELTDPALLERSWPSLELTVHDAAATADATEAGEDTQSPGPAVDQLELRRTRDDTDAGDAASAPQRTRYRAIWRPTQAGTFLLRVSDPALADLQLEQQVEVIAPDDELRNPEPDHDRLTRLAEQTGGAVVALDELDRLTELVPNRARRIAEDVRDPLWHSPLALLLVVLLLTVEWVGRKMIRLV